MEVYQKNKKTILVGLICFTYAGLFFPIQVSNIPLILLIVFGIINFDVKQFITSLKQSAFLKVILLMYVAQVVGLIYTSNLHNGFFVLEKKITFLVIPLFVFPLLHKYNINFSLLIRNLGIITLLSSVIFLVIAVYRTVILHDPLAFFYGRDLSEGFTSIHYPYYAMYFATGSIMLLDWLFEDWIKRKYGFLFISLLFLYSLGIMVLVASKTGIVAFGLASVVFLYFKLRNKKYALITISLFLVCASLFLYFNKTTLQRFEGLDKDLAVLKEDVLPDNITVTGLNMRLLFWKISIDHLWRDHHVVTGVGTGDAQDYIDALYNLPEYKLYGYIGWDSHNQWVFTLIQIGVIGVALMAILYGRHIRYAIKRKDLKFLAFLIITLWFSLSESILESNKGIVFFSLFFTILSSTYFTRSKGASPIDPA